MSRNLLGEGGNDDNLSSVTETESLLSTLYINLILFSLFMTFFEVNRHMKSTYLKRVTRKFQRSNRVPEPPSNFPFAWILSVMDVSEEDFLRMVGLDGYMLMRYINVCFRMSVFFTLWGMIVLVPVYSFAPGRKIAWNKFTLANIPNDPNANQLWVPAIFAYVFSIYFCHLMYTEYKNFVRKRVQYLIQGDPDTPPQTYYTVMVEKVPTSLRSAPALHAFFEKIFPGGVYSVEVALDLHELDALTLERRNVRNALEKAVAIFKATRRRPTQWIPRDFYKDSPELALPAVKEGRLARLLGYMIVDKIAHLTRVLAMLNESVRILQIATFQQRQKIHEAETERQQNIRGKLEAHAAQVAEKLREETVKHFDGVTHKVSRIFGVTKESTNNISSSTSNPTYGEDYEGRPQRIVGGSVSAESTYMSTMYSSVASSGGSVGAGAGAGAGLTVDCLGDDSDIESKRSPLLRGDQLGQMRISLQTGSRDAEQNDLYGGNDEDAISESEKEKTTRTSSATNGSYQLLPNDKHQYQQQKQTIQSQSYVQSQSRTNSHSQFQKEESISKKMLDLSVKIVGSSVGGLAKEGIKTASIATRGALRGVLEGIRAVELLTVGAYYKTSSTAFVTLKSRVAECSSHQMFLSHVNYSMMIKSAPNPKDCIWENISIPSKQISMRRTIADFTLIVGAVFWSIVVGFITAIANMDSLSKELPFLNYYRNTVVYQVLNNYLAVALLLILLTLLPIIFDVIARSYEGLKLESEIQNSIMTRYFYYQLANVFVSVGLGSIANSLHQIIESPSSILSILGTSLPSLSMYFTNLLIVKTFTAVPLEMLRVWPLIEILSVRMCQDKKKCTIRELKTGAFANPPMLYGWVYPNLLMVLMIVSTYCCIAPLLVPFGMLFYAFAYLMYKYQLLYVYINDYQSGGYMWYAVFNRSMLALICGVLTLLGYLGIRKTFFSGPFYLLVPLPFCISFFWYKCENRFKRASMCLSLDSAIDLDRATVQRVTVGLSVPHDTFRPTLFRQPSLAEGPLKPKPYRKPRNTTATTPSTTGSTTRSTQYTYGGLDSVLISAEGPLSTTPSHNEPIKKKKSSGEVALSKVTFGRSEIDQVFDSAETTGDGSHGRGGLMNTVTSSSEVHEYEGDSHQLKGVLRTSNLGDSAVKGVEMRGPTGVGVDTGATGAYTHTGIGPVRDMDRSVISADQSMSSGHYFDPLSATPINTPSHRNPLGYAPIGSPFTLTPSRPVEQLYDMEAETELVLDDDDSDDSEDDRDAHVREILDLKEHYSGGRTAGSGLEGSNTVSGLGLGSSSAMGDIESLSRRSSETDLIGLDDEAVSAAATAASIALLERRLSVRDHQSLGHRNSNSSHSQGSRGHSRSSSGGSGNSQSSSEALFDEETSPILEQSVRSSLSLAAPSRTTENGNNGSGNGNSNSNGSNSSSNRSGSGSSNGNGNGNSNGGIASKQRSSPRSYGSIDTTLDAASISKLKSSGEHGGSIN